MGGVDLFQTRGQFLSVWECSLILSEKSFEFVPFVPYLAGVVEVANRWGCYPHLGSEVTSSSFFFLYANFYFLMRALDLIEP